jgi:ribosomal protein L11 methyltransferase
VVAAYSRRAVLDLTASPWVTVRVVVPTDEAEHVIGRLWDGGVAGIEERPGPTHEDGTATVELLAGVPASDVVGVLEALAGPWTADVVSVEDDTWLDAWRDWARAWRAGSRLVVVPAWTDPPDWVGHDDVVLRLDPGRAFGSGAHATTRLCLAELEGRVGEGDEVLDVGCGSGVLAVAAARLGARRVEAVDIDPEAVRATTDNALTNAVSSVVGASTTPVEDVTGEFAVVVANIGAATLVGLAPALVARTTPAGTIVLSGLLAEQADLVTAAMEQEGAALVGTAADGEWRALVLERR